MNVSIIIEGVRGQLKGKKWVFENKSIIKIGRYVDSDIVIPAEETKISKLQCQIRIVGQEVVIMDKDGTSTSLSGTWVDNRKIQGGKKGITLKSEHLLGMGTAGNTELFKLQIKRLKEQDIVEPLETVGEENVESQLEKISVSNLKDAYRLLESISEFGKNDYAQRKRKQNEKWRTDRESLRHAVGLDEAYEQLSTILSENHVEEIRVAESPLDEEKPNSIKSSLDSDSFRIDLSDYDIVDVKPNLIFDDKKVKDEEEKAIDHKVKLAPIKVGGLKGEYKFIGNKMNGGFSFTIRVQHKENKKIFIMKELLSSIQDSQTIKWFKREVLIGQQLDHFNIVKIFEGDFDEKQQKYRYLMEYCAGGDLQNYMDELLKKGRTMEIKDAVQIMYQILDGLDYLHNAEAICFDSEGKAKKVKGLVHRDIKPKNIFLMKKGDISHIKIGDFGTLKSVELSGDSFQTRDKVVVISDGYTPAKQLNQRENGFKYAKTPVDVFASAAIFYFLLTGKTIKRRRNQDGEVEIVPIREINQRIPKELAEVIDNVLLEDNILDDDLVTSALQFKNNIKKAMKTI